MEKDLLKSENKLAANYHRTRMQKEMVLQSLKENGCRITKQRKILLDIILQEECACCKEIYYKAIAVFLQWFISGIKLWKMVRLFHKKIF